jgi:hypothetical protein
VLAFGRIGMISTLATYRPKFLIKFLISGHTDPKVEELKQEAWKTHGSREAWLTSARVRTTHYNRWGVTRPPLRWVLVENGSSIPQDALQTGEESSGEELYSARVWYNGGVHLGKVSAPLITLSLKHES